MHPVISGIWHELIDVIDVVLRVCQKGSGVVARVCTVVCGHSKVEQVINTETWQGSRLVFVCGQPL